MLDTHPSDFANIESFSSHPQSLQNIDIEIIILFSFVNFFYYFLCEALFKSSVGKYIFKGQLVDEDGNMTSIKDALERAICLVIMIAAAAYIRYPLNLNYFVSIILFFFVLDVPVLIRRKSAIDFATRTMYVKRRKINNIKSKSKSNKDFTKRQHIVDLTMPIILVVSYIGLFFILAQYSHLNRTRKIISDIEQYFEYNSSDKMWILKNADNLLAATYKTDLKFAPIGKLKNIYIGKAKGTYSRWNNEDQYYYDYSYDYKLYTFDLSEYNHAEDYNQILYKYQSQLDGYCSYEVININDELRLLGRKEIIKFVPKKLSALTYNYNGEKRFILFNNQQGYLLSTKNYYSDGIDSASFKDGVLSQFIFTNNHFCIKSVIEYIVSVFGLILFIAFSLAFVLLWKSHDTRKIENNKANIIYKYTVFFECINLLILFIQISSIYLDFIIQDDRWWTYFIIITSTIFLNTIIASYIKSKRYQEFDFEFILPSWAKTYIRNRASVKERKSIVILVAYPFIVLSVIPFGSISLMYTIPVATIVAILLEIRKLLKWVNEDSRINDENYLFKDYYLVLDIASNSNQTEIAQAFNACLAKYNSNANLFTINYKNNLIEAYRILSSSILKKEYDIEYKNHENLSSTEGYTYKNKKLWYEIQQIHSEIFNTGNAKSAFLQKFANTNLVAFAFVVYLIIALICFHAHYKDNNSSNYYSNGYSNDELMDY